MERSEPQLEAQTPIRISHWNLVKDHARLSPEVLNHKYAGSGTEDDPYAISWIPNDPGDPMGFSIWKKWAITVCVAFVTLAVSFDSSAYSGGIRQIIEHFKASEEVVILGISLFVLGFAIGPLLWAPLSELYGRQLLFFITFGAFTAFNAGAAGSQNIWTLIILRFWAGAFGSSPLTNAGGVIADLFSARERGLALSIFAAAPFLGPALGPIIGGFLSQAEGWRWNEGLMAILSGCLWIIGTLYIPETYPPVLLRKRASALSRATGKIYKTKIEIDRGRVSAKAAFGTALSRPWVLLVKEPIVLLLSVYMAILYGTLYMLFPAFPIVFQQMRGWSAGIGGLAFLGVMVGMISGVLYAIYDNDRYAKLVDRSGGFAPPEARLPPAMIGAVTIPIGLFWFGWTNGPSVHWIVSIMAGAPFGFGIVVVFLGIFNYLVDAYVIYAASVLAANSVLRSLFGAIFPLFTTYMYRNLGIHWATMIPAFLALACVPSPFLFYRYGAAIRARCKFAAEADAFMKKLREGDQPQVAGQSDSSIDGNIDKEKFGGEHGGRDSLDEDGEEPAGGRPGVRRVETTRSRRSVGGTYYPAYEENPYEIDRVNTRTFNETRSAKSEVVQEDAA